MAFGRYLEGRGMYEDYLEPSQGNVGTLATAGLLAAMLYTPLGGKIMGRLGAGAKGLGKGVKKVAPHVGRAAWRGAKRFAFDVKGPGGEVIKESILKNTIGGTGRAMRLLGKPMAWASNNPKAAYGIAIGAAALMGGAKGMRARQPYGETPTETIMFDPSTRRGLAPDHLGATGDLTLALHGRR